MHACLEKRRTMKMSSYLLNEDEASVVQIPNDL